MTEPELGKLLPVQPFLVCTGDVPAPWSCRTRSGLVGQPAPGGHTQAVTTLVRDVDQEHEDGS